MSHQTHYRSYQGRVLRVEWPNQQCQSTEGRVVSVLVQCIIITSRLFKFHYIQVYSIPARSCSMIQKEPHSTMQLSMSGSSNRGMQEPGAF